MYCRTIQDLYSDSGDSAGEYTDYENDNMVQYQAAIDVRTSLLWLSTNVDRIVELRAFFMKFLRLPKDDGHPYS